MGIGPGPNSRERARGLTATASPPLREHSARTLRERTDAPGGPYGCLPVTPGVLRERDLTCEHLEVGRG